MKSTENKKREGRNKNGGFPCSMMCQKDSTIDFLNKIKGSLKNKRFKYCSFYVKKKKVYHCCFYSQNNLNSSF